VKRTCAHLERQSTNGKSAMNWALMAAAGLGLCAIATKRARDRRWGFEDKVVVITGGSRGLGLVLARQLASQGAHLALLARSEADLRSAETQLRCAGVATDRVMIVPCDVTSQAEVEAAIGLVVAQFGRIDVLINNAGIIQVGPFEHMGIQDFQDAMNVHFWGPLFTMLEVIPQMRSQGGGRIVNISSIGGKVAVPHLSPYCASKFALVGLSDSMRSELSRHNIKVTTVCPWLMRTGSVYNIELKGKHQREFEWFAAGASVPVLTVSAERAARKIIEACRRGAPRFVMAPWGKIALLMNEFAPGAMASLQSLANRMMPKSAMPNGDWSRTGWESRSKRLPAAFTRKTWEAAKRNNEIPQAIRSTTAPNYEHSHLSAETE
jgi:NAD(P)-dependent dehydrogenase (short-subunit alcohol dehydrogenase family)